MTPASPELSAEPSFRIAGWHVLVAIVTFFGVVIAADICFSVLAVRTFPGAVSVTPYEDGLLYNRHLRQMADQEQLGWRASASAAPDRVVMRLVDRQGAPLEGLRIEARLERPATEAGRVSLKLLEDAPGTYSGPARGLTGTWDLTAVATGERGERFEAERRLTWP